LPQGWPVEWTSIENTTQDSKRRVREFLRSVDLHRRHPQRQRHGKSIVIGTPLTVRAIIADDQHIGAPPDISDFLREHS